MQHKLFPKLRWPLEVRFTKHEGQEILMMRDPLGITKEPLILVPQIAPLVACFEGNMSTEQIIEKFSGQVGKDKITQIVNDLLVLLDQNLFLANANFFAAEKQFKIDYHNADLRPAALAGLAYSGDKLSLENEIKGYLLDATGSKEHQTEMLGLVSPHIDYRRGSTCYGKTYHFLKKELADLFILMGTAHQYSEGIFHLTKKHFETPLGNLNCDQELVKQIAKLYGEDRSFKDEILHKSEHSLELQTPFLKYCNQDVKILPILVGGFHNYLNTDKTPNQFEEYESFICAITESLKVQLKQNRKICFIAGVDMAHIGRYFGDKKPLTPEFMQEIATKDQIYLDSIVEQNKKKMYEHVASDNDQRRICGFPTMYSIIDICDRLGLKYKAQVFDYRQAVDYQSDCAVTFAGLGLYL